jgi:hypothetical protein
VSAQGRGRPLVPVVRIGCRDEQPRISDLLHERESDASERWPGRDDWYMDHGRVASIR